MFYDGTNSPGYHLEWGSYWKSTHFDGSNGSRYSDDLAMWIRRVLGEPIILEPVVWQPTQYQIQIRRKKDNLMRTEGDTDVDQQSLRTWEQTVDTAETQPLGANLPNLDGLPPGVEYIEPINDLITRRWRLVTVNYGQTGGRWAYYLAWTEDGKPAQSGPSPAYDVVVDKLFNGDAPHFAGMLADPWAGRPKHDKTVVKMWVLVEPKATPPPTIYEVEEKPKERYEKSREIYDVETGQTTKIDR